MLSKNGLLITHSCLDCRLNILSDVHIKVLDSFDWRLLVFLERYPGAGRPREYSAIAFLRAFLYMELSGITSVRNLVRLLARDKYKMKNLGFSKLPHHSLFSRYKQQFGEHIPRIMMIINTSIMNEEPLHMSMLGIDSTKVDFKVNTILADKAYDTRENIENHSKAGVLFIAARNKRNTKKQVNKYRIQDYFKVPEEEIDRIYKNRMDCEHANFLLKEQLSLSNLKTTGREKVRIKVGITLIARLIQALHQLTHNKNPRTTIIN